LISKYEIKGNGVGGEFYKNVTCNERYGSYNTPYIYNSMKKRRSIESRTGGEGRDDKYRRFDSE